MTVPMKFALTLFALLATSPSWAAIEGHNLFDNKKQELQAGKKGTVLVFLSAKCPCSNSHVEILKQLAKDYPHFNFAAIHSNSDESLADARNYFEAAALPFPVLQDEKAKLADQFKALKTPHTFLLSPEGKILYSGGVTNSAVAGSADRQYLREALSDIEAGREVKLSEGRSLGCIIKR